MEDSTLRGEEQICVRAMNVRREALFERGLTWRVIFAMLFTTALLMPIHIFTILSLSNLAGAGFLGGYITSYITLVLFYEISRLFGRELTRQEVTMIYFLSSMPVTSSVFITVLYNYYVRHCPLTQSFLDPLTGMPIPVVLPEWFAPKILPSGFNVILLSREWFLPISVQLLFICFALMSEMGLSLITAQLFVVVERLPFPVAVRDVRLIEVLSGAREELRRAFAMATVLGILWALLVYALPNLAVGIFGVSLAAMGSGVVYGGGSWIPTYFDLSWYLSWILPGAGLALNLDLITMSTGFLLPYSSVLSMLIGSLMISVLGNAVALKLDWPAARAWQQDYTPGMSYPLIYWRSWMWIWLSFTLGASVAVAVHTLVTYRRSILRAFISLRKLRRARGEIPLQVIALMVIVGITGTIVLYKTLIPAYPLWNLLLFSGAWVFASALINSLGQAEAGFNVQIPLIDRVAVIASGYAGADAWYAPIYVGGIYAPVIGTIPTLSNAAQFCYVYKVAYETRTNPLDFYKGLVVSMVFGVVFGLIWTQAFLMLAPIPSGVYPGTIFSWAYRAQHTMMFITWSKVIFNRELMLIGFAVASSLILVSRIVNLRGLSIIALLIGMGMPVDASIALSLGYVIGRVVGNRLGEDRWREIRGAVVAGLMMGAGLMTGIAVTIIMIARAIWPLPL